MSVGSMTQPTQVKMVSKSGYIMDEEQSQNNLSGWCSTYGIITAQRILEMYKIKLQSDDLIHALRTPNSFYNQLLRIPLGNVFNGIILQQSRDYQLYAQKLFIDYLLSGETGKEDTSPGGGTREDLEVERKTLLEMTEKFHACELEHERLIAKSQTTLMNDVVDWNKLLGEITLVIKNNLRSMDVNKSDKLIMQALITLLVRYEVKNNSVNKKESWGAAEKILETSLTTNAQQVFENEIGKLSNFVSEAGSGLLAYQDQVKQMGLQARQYRTDFYIFIIHVNELLKLLPDYKIDVIQDLDNREALYFDSTLGGNADSR